MFLGIDPGIRTLSWALVNETGVVEAGTTDLIAGVPKKKHKKYAWLVHRWMQAHIHLFDAELIVVEQQMSQKMRIVETALSFGNFSRTVVIPPVRWRKYHKISTGNYRRNKKESIKKIMNITLPTSVRTLLASKKKKDDIAEAILISLFARHLSHGALAP